MQLNAGPDVDDFLNSGTLKVDGVQILKEPVDIDSKKRRRKQRDPKPRWLKGEIPSGENYTKLKETVSVLLSILFCNLMDNCVIS